MVSLNCASMADSAPVGVDPKASSAADAEEQRLRDLLRGKRRRQSDPEICSTGVHVDSTQGSAPTTKSPLSAIISSTKQNSVQSQLSSGKPSGTVSVNVSVSRPQDKATIATRNSSKTAAGTRCTLPTPTESQSKGSGQPSRSVSTHALGDPRSTQQRERGRKPRRERRRMNREARRRGEPVSYDNRSGGRDGNGHPSGGRGGPPPPYRGGGPDRWQRYPPPQEHRRGSPMDRRGPPPPRNEYDYSNHQSRSQSRSNSRSHRGRRRRSRSPSASSGSDKSAGSRSGSRSASRSYSRSRSRSRPRRDEDRSRSRSIHGSPDRRASRLSHSDRRSGSGRRRSGSGDNRGSKGSGNQPRKSQGSGGHLSHSDSSSSGSTSSSSSSSSEDQDSVHQVDEESPFSKDQRTVFVSQLVMRATEKDIRRYFKKKVGCKVKDVILLRDKRTGSHKGSAYVQLGRIEDVNKAVGVAGQPPDFQRFPILVKPSEAEKNYFVQASSSSVTASMMGATTSATPLMSTDGKLIESQKVYVGGLDPSVSEEHIFALFSQFGQLEKVTMQMDPTTRTSRGYAFLSFRDPKEANLAIQTMANQVLAGRPMKTGWASQAATVQGVEMVTSDGLPEDASVRARKSFAVLAQMTGTTDTPVITTTISATAERAIDAAMAGVQEVKTSASAVPTVAEARANLAAQQSVVLPDPLQLPPSASVTGAATTEAPKMIGGCETPTRFILVHNMFDKDQESGDGWPAEIKEEFEEECIKFGKISSVTVMSREPGGQIYATFEVVDAAVQCAKNLAGRWFDKRQLRVDYMEETYAPNTSE